MEHQPDQLTVLSNRPLAEGIYSMELEVPQKIAEAFQPGQFAHVKIPGAGELLLRRPISIHYMENGTMALAYHVVGKGTKLLSRVKRGEILDVLAPLGNGFSVAGKKKIWLIGGGIGIAPLLSLRSLAPETEFCAFLGYRNKGCVYRVKEFEGFNRRVFVATDDGSYGEHCLVTDMLRRELERERPDTILACGPTPMFRSLKKIQQETGVQIQASLEQRMGCGTGGCAVCVCKVAGNYKKTCLEGPVFPLEEVEL